MPLSSSSLNTISSSTGQLEEDGQPLMIHADGLPCLKRQQLENLCIRLGVKSTGKKSELITRLEGFAMGKSASVMSYLNEQEQEQEQQGEEQTNSEQQKSEMDNTDQQQQMEEDEESRDDDGDISMLPNIASIRVISKPRESHFVSAMPDPFKMEVGVVLPSSGSSNGSLSSLACLGKRSISGSTNKYAGIKHNLPSTQQNDKSEEKPVKRTASGRSLYQWKKLIGKASSDSLSKKEESNNTKNTKQATSEVDSKRNVSGASSIGSGARTPTLPPSPLKSVNSRTKGRFSSQHEKQFGRMDSIVSHYSALRKQPSPYTPSSSSTKETVGLFNNSLIKPSTIKTDSFSSASRSSSSSIKFPSSSLIKKAAALKADKDEDMENQEPSNVSQVRNTPVSPRGTGMPRKTRSSASHSARSSIRTGRKSTNVNIQTNAARLSAARASTNSRRIIQPSLQSVNQSMAKDLISARRSRTNAMQTNGNVQRQIRQSTVEINRRSSAAINATATLRNSTNSTTYSPPPLPVPSFAAAGHGSPRKNVGTSAFVEGKGRGKSRLLGRWIG
ncbi:hypothetical protein L7F22_039292 [Adiantum nelumboides]|nr:hypothetical protein [Adiantum nelumboides]